MKYLIVIEQGETGFSAYAPDIPGCIATGSTRDDVEREMKDAIAFHLDGLRAEGMAIPKPSTSSSYSRFPRSVLTALSALSVEKPSLLSTPSNSWS